MPLVTIGGNAECLDVIDVADLGKRVPSHGHLAEHASLCSLPGGNDDDIRSSEEKEDAAPAANAQAQATKSAVAGTKATDDTADDGVSVMTVDTQPEHYQGDTANMRYPQYRDRKRRPVHSQTHGCSTSEASTCTGASVEFKGFHAGKGPYINTQRPLESSLSPPEAVLVEGRTSVKPSEASTCTGASAEFKGFHVGKGPYINIQRPLESILSPPEAVLVGGRTYVKPFQPEEVASENPGEGAKLVGSSSTCRRRRLSDATDRRRHSDMSIGSKEKVAAETRFSGPMCRRRTSLSQSIKSQQSDCGSDNMLTTEVISSTTTVSGNADVSKRSGEKVVVLGEGAANAESFDDAWPRAQLHCEMRHSTDLEHQVAQLNFQLAQIQSDFGASQLKIRKLAKERDDSRAKLEAAEAENEKLRKTVGALERERIVGQIRGTSSGGNYIHLEKRPKPLSEKGNAEGRCADGALIDGVDERLHSARTTSRFGKEQSQQSLIVVDDEDATSFASCDVDGCTESDNERKSAACPQHQDDSLDPPPDPRGRIGANFLGFGFPRQNGSGPLQHDERQKELVADLKAGKQRTRQKQCKIRPQDEVWEDDPFSTMYDSPESDINSDARHHLSRGPLAMFRRK